MICKDKGVLSKSEYFFLYPSKAFFDHYFYMTVCGHLYCNKAYKITRNHNNSVPSLFFYIIKGRFNLHYNDNIYTAKEHDMVLIDCHKPHKYYCETSCEFLFFHFDGCTSIDITNHLITQNGSPLFHLNSSQFIYNNLQAFHTNLCHGQIPTDVELSCIVYNTLCTLQSVNEIMSTHPNNTNLIIQETFNYIRSHINEKITLEKLSSNICLSKYYFAHIFKQETGTTPMKYLSETRINLARTMLKTTERSISDISVDLGYSSSSSFINAFTADIGMSPSKYRSSVNNL
jgi:AraC-like DNA-binding protein